MGDFVTEKHVFVQQDLADRVEVLRFICARARELGIISDADQVFEAFLAREAMGETGMTDGFAVPHAKSEAVREASVIVVKTTQPLDWPSFDEKPVDIALALLVPDEEAGTTHIKLLSKTAILLMDSQFKATVRSTNDPAIIARAINEGIAE